MEKELIKNYKKWYFVIPFLLFLIIALLMCFHCLDNIDLAISLFVFKMRTPILTEFLKVCSFIGDTPGYVILVILFCFINWKKSLTWGASLLFIQGINRIVKYFIHRPRPSIIYRLVKESNYSFPSGHAMSSIAGFGALIMCINATQWKYKKLMSIILGILIFCICFSRIYLGVHYFFDVLAGILLSYSYILFIKYNTSLLKS